MEKSSGLSNLPKFEDRVPDLVQALKTCGYALSPLKPPNSYLPFWEELYQAVHTMKGIVNILKASAEMRAFLVSLHETILAATTGTKVVRANAEIGAKLIELASHLEANFERPDYGFLEKKTLELAALYTEDLPHHERITVVPGDLYYVNEFVSKKVREIQALEWNHCLVEDDILLEQIPFWRAQLQQSLTLPDGNRGFVVNFLPFISSEGSKMLKIWAWVAAPTDSRAALKQRIKDEMPKVKITTLKLRNER